MSPFEPGRKLPRKLPARSLDFWFDYTCPYAYLGSTQAEAVAARMRVPLTYKPLLLGGVFRANDTPQKLFATLSPAKAAHNARDLQRWAERFGVTLRMPAEHPLRSVEALRATIACDVDEKVVAGFYRAYWVENAPLSDPEVIRRVVTAAGYDGDRVLDAIATTEIKEDLRRRTDEAIALGIFGVPAWIVDGEHLYWGQDRIHFVEGLPRTVVDAPPAAPTSRTLDVYWDFSSPFAYLGATQVPAVARRTGARVTWRPLLLGGLFRSIGTPDAPILSFSEAKRQYLWKDLERAAAYLGVPYRFPSRFPMSTVKALRVYLALPEDRQSAYRDAVFHAYWAEDRDIASADVLASLVGDEAAAREALAKAESEAVKAELRRCTEEASARGVFGVPTWIVDGTDLYWGQDRLEVAEEALLLPAAQKK